MKMCFAQAPAQQTPQMQQQSVQSQQDYMTTRQQVQVQQTPQMPQQPVQSQQDNKTTRQQVQVQQQPQQPQQAQQPQTVVRGRLNRAATISITADEPKKQEVAEEVWNDDFSQEQLTKAWNDFVVSYQNVSPVFVAGIKNSEPVMNGKSEIRFKIDNILVVKDVNNMQALHEYLKKALHNNQFVLKEDLLERPREVVLYTDKQKFEKMANDNPNLFDIKESLKLDINV
jgi:hypothetical protein